MLKSMEIFSRCSHFGYGSNLPFILATYSLNVFSIMILRTVWFHAIRRCCSEGEGDGLLGYSYCRSLLALYVVFRIGGKVNRSPSPSHFLGHQRSLCCFPKSNRVISSNIIPRWGAGGVMYLLITASHIGMDTQPYTCTKTHRQGDEDRKSLRLSHTHRSPKQYTHRDR